MLKKLLWFFQHKVAARDNAPNSEPVFDMNNPFIKEYIKAEREHKREMEAYQKEISKYDKEMLSEIEKQHRQYSEYLAWLEWSNSR